MSKSTVVLVFGGTGILGAPLALRFAELGHRVHIVSRTRRFPGTGPIHSVRCDLRMEGVAESLLRELKPALVINCAAETSIEACEERGAAQRVNADWPGELAAAAAVARARCVHISTDSVFSRKPGQKKPREHDTPNPVNEYARQKARAEDAVLDASNGEALVIRTNFFGWSPIPGRGLAAWALRELRGGRQIQGFADVFFNPLYTGDVIDLVIELLDADAVGVVHVLGAQCLSKLSFVRCLVEVFSLDPHLVEDGRLEDAPLVVPRPSNTCLATHRLERLIGRRPPTAGEGLRRMLREEKSLCAVLATLEEYPRRGHDEAVHDRE
jgi:dTDP-4-dehydrorhamnose reductase